MNYKEKYIALVNKIHKAHLYAQTDSTRAVLEEIRPELRDVGDEEVRRAMIDFFKHEREEGIAVLHYGVDIERMISWLEKYDKGIERVKPERNPDQKDETLTKLIEEIDRLDEERKQNTKYKSAKSGFAHTVNSFFLSNEIKTLDELLSLGRKHVARCRNIGKMTMWAIDKALENLYGITEW